MSARLGDVVATLEHLYPLDWAEEWDRVGLVVGDPAWDVTRVRLAVDPTLAEAREAARHKGTLLVTHHPLLLRGVHTVTTTTGKGAVITELTRASSALWCGHTNADRAMDGTVGAWIRLLRLEDATPLASLPAGKDAQTGATPFGLGAVGHLTEPLTVQRLAQRIAHAVPPTAQGVLFTGDSEREVRRVAVCPGAGDSFLDTARELGVDAYITSDLRHHPALEHIESASDPSGVPALVDLPHYASEFVYLPHLAQLLRAEHPDLAIDISTMSSDPFTGACRRDLPAS